MEKGKLTVDHDIYRAQCAVVNKMLNQTRVNYYSDKVSSCGSDQKSLNKITKHLLEGQVRLFYLLAKALRNRLKTLVTSSLIRLNKLEIKSTQLSSLIHVLLLLRTISYM